MVSEFIIRLASVIVAGTAIGAFIAGMVSFISNNGRDEYRERAILWAQDLGYLVGTIALAIFILERIIALG